MSNIPKVVVTGPECIGKTTLTRGIAQHFEVPLVPEFAREYLTGLIRDYTKYDLNRIALGQYNSELALYSNRPSLLLCDTSLLVIKIWSEYKYGQVHPAISSLYEFSKPDLYILPDWKIPYEEDILRENPDDRRELHQVYLNEIASSGSIFIQVTGSPEERLKQSIEEIESLLPSDS